MGGYSDTTLSDAGEIIGDGKIVVLEPEKWAGKRFPLLDYIDVGDKLKEDTWLVLLYHHDCPRCQETIQNLPQITRRHGIQKVAMIEVPPYSESKTLPAPGEGTLICGRLSDLRKWFADTPVALVLRDGKIELPSELDTHLR